jgi:hypothetical protein
MVIYVFWKEGWFSFRLTLTAVKALDPPILGDFDSGSVLAQSDGRRQTTSTRTSPLDLKNCARCQNHSLVVDDGSKDKTYDISKSKKLLF